MFKLVSDFRNITDKKFMNFCSSYIKKRDRIVEIGPGDGLFADEILRIITISAYEFIDIKDKRSYRKELNMQICDVSAEKIPKENESVDIIIASQVLEHLKNMGHFFDESCRVLKNEGLLLIKFPNYCSLLQKLKFFKNAVPHRLGGTISNGGHINFISYKWLLFFLREYFQPIMIKGDLFVDFLFTRKFFNLLKKDLYLINSNIESLNFSWNIMIALRKNIKK
ncbi:MAG: class I SAM-dependent methyltransferase [Candidatus Omnitrophota bacterium]|jgi:ubiquinone/menaquinone biosynthesis C-methylase UbiE